MSNFNIVLVEPEIPPNTGSIARLCGATESTLHLVHPLGFSTEDKHLKRAGLDYWRYVSVVHWHDLDHFLATCSEEQGQERRDGNPSERSSTHGWFLSQGRHDAAP